MKCPKCHYVSHDYLDACRKCGIDLVTFKQDIGLLVLQPGVLDLSLVLGGAGADDLFESVEEEVSLRASDEEFDISLDDYAEHPGVRRTPAGVPRPGRPESGTELTGMDHLTLELDATELPPEMTARLRAARVIDDEPPTVPMQPPAELGAVTLPRDVTLETEAENITSEIPTAILHNIVSSEASPHQAASASQATPEVPTLQFDVSHADMAGLTPADTPETTRSDAAEAESVPEAVRLADSSGNLVSLPLQDVVLAEDTSASTKHASEAVEPTIPIIDIFDVATVSAPDVTAAATGDAPRQEAMGLQSSLHDDLSTLADAEATLSDLAAPTLDEAPLTSTAEVAPRLPSALEGMPTAAETPPEGLLTPSDMLALENLEDSMPPEHLTLELEPPVLPTDLASNLPAEDAPTLLPAPPEVPETLTNAGPEPALPVVEAVTFEDLDDIALPSHLTLEFDGSETASEIASITLDNPPNDTQSPLSHDDQADDEAELLLDLDDLELDDDESA